jgi:type II secretory pathway predicted ATPase ExeA
MDRPTNRTEAHTRSSRLDQDEALVLASRQPALDLCRSVQFPGRGEGESVPSGPVLVTGDAGVGKTWLWRRLEAESRPGHRWIAVDLTPSDDPVDFYRLIAHELGLIDPATTGPATSRVGLVDVLDGRRADGERISLVVEEAHNLSSELWEEVRVLANRLDRPGGFASMILVGQTSLALRFLTRPFAAIEARLASRVHLGPIGVDEARELLTRLQPSREWPDDEVETLHRDASGNPRRLLRQAYARIASANRQLEQKAPNQGRSENRVTTAIGHRLSDASARRFSAGQQAPVAAPIASSMPLTGPPKPPIQADENMIEVGWAPEEASSLGARDGSQSQSLGTPAPPEGSEEAVRDHYAALQAWREWSENQVRRTHPPLEADEDELEDEIEDIEDEAPGNTPSPLVDRPTVRAEGEQKFAPFGQLFSKMAHARDLE